jgi:hypothetical protein
LREPAETSSWRFGADELLDIAVAREQGVEVLLELEPLLAGGDSAAVPVDDRDLAALAGGERQRVEQVAE